MASDQPPEGFEWDPAKAALNVANHGVTFEEAATVFDDEGEITIPDDAHSDGEDRLFTLGRSAANRLLAVASTMRGDVIRIISARPATPRERRRHGNG